MSKNRVLIIDDDHSIGHLLKRLLTDYDFKSTICFDTTQAKEYLAQYTFDIMIVDVMLPGENGFKFVKDTQPTVPVLFLTACNQIDDKIQGFASGGDDYLTKPFEPLELVWRLNTLIKRYKKKTKAYIGSYEIGVNDLYHRHTGEALKLSILEMNIITILIQNKNQPFSREELAKINRVDLRTIDVQVNRLRKKIGDYDRNLIKSIRHIGYAIEVFEEE